MGPAALATLPGWIRWGFVAHWVAAFVAAFLLRAEQAIKTERANPGGVVNLVHLLLA
jgi:hypothetical protein